MPPPSGRAVGPGRASASTLLAPSAMKGPSFHRQRGNGGAYQRGGCALSPARHQARRRSRGRRASCLKVMDPLDVRPQRRFGSTPSTLAGQGVRCARPQVTGRSCGVARSGPRPLQQQRRAARGRRYLLLDKARCPGQDFWIPPPDRLPRTVRVRASSRHGRAARTLTLVLHLVEPRLTSVPSASRQVGAARSPLFTGGSAAQDDRHPAAGRGSSRRKDAACGICPAAPAVAPQDV